MKKILLPGFLALLCFSACKKNNDSNDNNNNNEKGVVTSAGTPDGTAASKSIGAQGGSITSTDGRLTIDVPAGAFTNSQQITIQPITNNGPGGVNKAYRITPHNVQFAQAVKITFHYTGSDTSGSAPEFLGISYQDEQGIWQAKRATHLDTVAKTVSTNTRHFSDWNIFQGLTITPEDTVISTGKSVQLKVFVELEDLLVPIPSNTDDDLFMPLPSSKEIPEKYVRRWIKSGEGSLAVNGNKATYTAPGTVPARNPVAVSAELEIAGKGKLYLVSNITVINDEGVIVNAGAGAGSGSHLLARVPQAMYDSAKNETRITAYEEGGDARNSKRIEIVFKGTGMNNAQWDADAGIQCAYIVKENGVNTVYNSIWSDAITWHNSPGGVYINRYGNKGDYVIGSFSVSKSGYQNGNETTTSVSGSFKVKRV